MAGLMAEKVSETFSFAKKIPMLIRATADNDNPTPGYIYQEINNITYESINSCNSLLDYLVGRLKKQSPYIKYKVLKILCYLSSNGHSEFRSGLRHKADVLREAENFTGKMDYLKGDSPNERVRAAASELVELLFNVESNRTIIHAMSGPTGMKMEGFGNSPLQPAKSKTLLDSMKNLAERLPDVASLMKHKTDQENMPPAESSGTAFVNYVDFASVDLGFKRFLDGNVSLETSENEYEDLRDSENELSVEAHLVNKITSEGGIRSVPSKEDLFQFTKRCSALNIDKVLSALNDRLLEPVTEVQLKSLHVIDHLLKSDFPDVATKMHFFCTNLQEIMETDSGSVVSKATKVLSIIKAKTENEKVKNDAQQSVNDSQMSNVGNTQDLLNLDSSGDTANIQQAVSGDTSTLFSGMSLHSQTKNTSSAKQPGSPPTVVANSQHPSKDLEVFLRLDLSDGNRRPGNGSSSPVQSSKSDLDDLLFFTKEAKEPSPVELNQGPVEKSSVTDLFDPLCNTHKTAETTPKGFREQRKNTKSKSDSQPPQLISYERSLISSNENTVSPGTSTLTRSFYDPVTSLSGTFEDLTAVTRNNTVQPIAISNVTLTGNALPPSSRYVSNFPNTSHPMVHPSVLSGGSTIPLRLPPPSQKTDFSFVGKSGKTDAFSFVQDEMKARK